MLQWWLVPQGSGGVACRKGMSYKFYKTAFLQSKEEVKKMNNKLSRMLALAMAGALVLSGCGGSEQGGNTNSEGG